MPDLESISKFCFAAQPLVWAVAIILILLALYFFAPRIFGLWEDATGEKPKSTI